MLRLGSDDWKGTRNSPPAILGLPHVHPTRVAKIARAGPDASILALELLCKLIGRFEVKKEGVIRVLQDLSGQSNLPEESISNGKAARRFVRRHNKRAQGYNLNRNEVLQGLHIDEP